MPAVCVRCTTQRAVIVRPKNHDKLCKPCFLEVFETEVHQTIIRNALFQRGERIAIGASGGKDSTVLASVLKTLNERYNYGVELLLLSIDEGIRGYRDDSLETVKRNATQYEMPLTIVGYGQLYGWTMDQVVEQVGKKGNCTYCGVFRRQALDRGSAMLGVQHVVTGHNADDMAETVMMNLLRGDLARLSRTTSIITSSPSAIAASNAAPFTHVKRSKPLKYAYEKEIVLYAHHKKLDYFSTECIYSPEAFRGSARALIKSLERIRPSSILDIVRSGEDMAKLCPGYEDVCRDACGTAIPHAEEEEGGCGSSAGRTVGSDMGQVDALLEQAEKSEEKSLEIEIPLRPAANGIKNSQKKAMYTPRKKHNAQKLGECERCGYMSSQKICKACVLLEGLNKSRPRTDVSVGADP